MIGVCKWINYTKILLSVGTPRYETCIDKGYMICISIFNYVLTCVILDGILNLYFENVLCVIFWWVAMVKYMHDET